MTTSRFVPGVIEVHQLGGRQRFVQFGAICSSADEKPLTYAL